MTKPRPLFALSLLILAAVPVYAAPPVQIRAAVQGELIEAKGTSERAEIVSFGAELVPGLLKAAENTTVRVADWPVGPDERADVLLTRFDVYAPGAKVFVVEGPGERDHREIPRSRLAFFSGTAADDPEMTVFAAVDPDTGHVNGFTQTRDAFHELHPLSHVPSLAVEQGTRSHLVAPAEVFLKERGEQSSWACGQSGAPLDFMQEMQDRREKMVAETAPFGSVSAQAISTLHTATIAVDTDNELLSIKFGNNTTTATNYIASLIASMTVIYERDALVRLLQGQTFLRPSTTPDPYVQTGGNASGAKLQEFSNVWNTTHAGVTRALAMMLSGKGGSGASGIAWLTSLCSKYYGTSFTQVFTSGTTPSSGDILVVAHELGHNFGSPHTHCYANPIDNCYNAEGGCFAGTRSCPAAQTINGVTSVTGTLMSYCHLSGLAGCSSKTVFHPRTISEKLAPAIQTAVSSCIFPAAAPPPPAPVVSAVSPKSGTTAGGTAVTITGTGFQAGATVTFGGSAASSVVVVNSTRITAVTPARSTGKVAVAVTNPTAQSSSLADGFFYSPPPTLSDFYTVTPCRVVDTRNAIGARGGPVLSPSQIRTFPITGVCGIPANAKSVVVNITSVTPGAAGNFQVFPGNAFPMGTSVVNFSAGQVRASSSILMLATNGTGTLGVQNSSAGNTHFLLDVTG
ncbi:MAG TPA: M12 family metallo-peptidase, partial [Thermoanaerobaculia bacterium]|nr:M12 family metallo-peptidase [Thermoanaerobaculia bacterium]